MLNKRDLEIVDDAMGEYADGSVEDTVWRRIKTALLELVTSHNSTSPKCCECGKRFRIAEWGFITKNGLHHANCADHNTSGE